MANELSTVLETEWAEDVRVKFQQTKSHLRQAVQEVTGVNAETYTFPLLAPITATSMSALGVDHVGIAAVHTKVSATLTDKTAPVYLKKLEMEKVSANPQMREAYIKISTASLARDCDTKIVAAWDASFTADGAAATAGLTQAKIGTAIERLNEADTNMGGERFLVVGPQQINDLQQISTITSSDYDRLNSVRAGNIESVFGVKVIMSNLLTKNAAIRDCYMVQGEATGLAVGHDIETEVEYLTQKTQWIINSFSSFGAVTIQPLGVIQIQATEV